MRVLFDARCIGDELSATRVYVRELLRRLPKLATDWTWHVVVRDNAIARSLIAEAGMAGFQNVAFETLPYGFTSLVGNARLTALLVRRRCDIYFSPMVVNSFLAFGGFRGACHAAVVAVHGNPTHGSGGPFRSFARRFCLSRAVAGCAAVIADSATLRDGLISMLRLNPSARSKLRMVYGGVSEAFEAMRHPSCDGRTPILLYVGCDKPHKNLSTLVRAFAELRRRADRATHLLVVCDDISGGTRGLVRDLGIADDVSFVSVPASRELAIAYGEAAMLVSPSGHEGFSLPIVEAMAAGTPIICCDDASRDEISHGAAIHAQPGDEHALCAAMERMLSDEGLRAECVRRGRERARDFSWDKTAEETLHVFREAAGHGKGAR